MVQINISGIEFNKETVLEIGKFAILWNIFEKEKCQNDFNIERLSVFIFSKIAELYWVKLSKVFQNRVDTYDDNVDNYINSKLSIGRGLKDIEKEYVKEFINTEGQNSLIGGLIAIYRIRNNMYHGLKDVSCLNAQIDLFKGINEFLTVAIKEL